MANHTNLPQISSTLSLSYCINGTREHFNGQSKLRYTEHSLSLIFEFGATPVSTQNLGSNLAQCAPASSTCNTSNFNTISLSSWTPNLFDGCSRSFLNSVCAQFQRVKTILQTTKRIENWFLFVHDDKSCRFYLRRYYWEHQSDPVWKWRFTLRELSRAYHTFQKNWDCIPTLKLIQQPPNAQKYTPRWLTAWKEKQTSVEISFDDLLHKWAFKWYFQMFHYIRKAR